MNYQKLKIAYRNSQILNNPINRQIFKALKDGDSLTVTEIMIATRRHYPNVCTRVSQLHKLGFLTKEKSGSEVYVSLNIDKIESTVFSINKFLYPKELAV